MPGRKFLLDLPLTFIKPTLITFTIFIKLRHTATKIHLGSVLLLLFLLLSTFFRASNCFLFCVILDTCATESQLRRQPSPCTCIGLFPGIQSDSRRKQIMRWFDFRRLIFWKELFPIKLYSDSIFPVHRSKFLVRLPYSLLL
ncbi:hypothetical protein RvY_08943-2 [Ramazzottius varieornatus]|uniref:Uncharacterized protein n=1 Tax=Ramazzottius varieornatus TaxID=947166 RepID=A0A1D1VC80_RAMVA|nr:hypothetical protein RvY_08943-2 [Ramazzottius varieornatus]